MQKILLKIEQCSNFKDFQADKPAIAVIRLPHIANFTDFHALSKIDDIQTIFIDKPDHLSKFKAVIIPGSKNTRKDLEWLMNNFKEPLEKYYKSKGHVFGICGGYQMLGEFVDDPEGLEGNPGITKALEFLPIQTILKSPKTTTISEFSWNNAKGKGYEIHMGHTILMAGTPLLEINSRNSITCTDTDGCTTDNHQVAGTYIHGFFDSQQVFSKWMGWAGINLDTSCEDMNSIKEKEYVLLKKHFEKYIDIRPIL